MSNMSIARPRLVCGLMLGLALCMSIACVVTIGPGWRTIVTVALCTGGVVHALAVPGERSSDMLRLWRMTHVGLTVVCMSIMLPDHPVGNAVMHLLPVLTLLPLVAMATIRQSVGRSAALVPMAS